MKMVERKVVAMEGAPDHTFIVTEQPFLFFWKWKRKFVATEESPRGYWNWLEMDAMKLVPDVLSFQLDAWNRMDETTRRNIMIQSP